MSRIIATKCKKPLEFTKCFISVMSSNPHKHPASFFLGLQGSFGGTCRGAYFPTFPCQVDGPTLPGKESPTLPRLETSGDKGRGCLLSQPVTSILANRREMLQEMHAPHMWATEQSLPPILQMRALNLQSKSKFSVARTREMRKWGPGSVSHTMVFSLPESSCYLSHWSNFRSPLSLC